jgi:hypothetical protein
MMPPHRRLVANLELALECLDEAATLGFLPHWGEQQVRMLADDLADLLERVGREIPTLAQDEMA